jgi:hypothetical protein
MAVIQKAAAGEKSHILTIAYAKEKQADGSFRLHAELRRAAVNADLLANAIGADGLLDFNAHREFSVATNNANYGKGKKPGGGFYNSNEDFSSQTRITFVTDPETDEGTFAYWENPGSNYTEAARGMVANIALDAGVKKGCAVSGAALDKTNLGNGYSIASALKQNVVMAPNGFYHPFFNVPASTQTGCTMPTQASDADGTFWSNTCTPGGQTQVFTWYVPQTVDATAAGEFTHDQRGDLFTRQCYMYDQASGKYVIDTAQTPDGAGFELVRNTNAAKMIAPPTLGEHVGPIQGATVKPEQPK